MEQGVVEDVSKVTHFTTHLGLTVQGEKKNMELMPIPKYVHLNYKFEG